MADQNLLTIFVAVTALAVVLQTGILVGFYFASLKLSRQFDQAMDLTRNLFGPLQRAVENLRSVTARIAEFSESTRGHLRQIENWWRRSA
jgi:hypothetical protein